MSQSMIQTARAFLGELAANNEKLWWEANKGRYVDDLKGPATALLDHMAADLAARTGDPVTTKLFRPHRDVRFSKDKTPYNTHLHMLWTRQAGASHDPGIFFGISPDYVSLGGGIMGFEKPALEEWRKMVDLDGDRIAGVIAKVAGAGFELRAPDLKRVPAPFDKDHPHADLLKRKGLVMWKELPATADPFTALPGEVGPLIDLQDMLLSVI